MKMKKDWLEKYIFENKEELNNLKAPDDLWAKIDKQLDQKPKSKSITMSWMRVAALFFGILLSGITIGKIYFNNPTYQTANITQIENNEEYLMPRVDFKVKQAKMLNAFDSKLESHLEKLDNVYAELKNEYLNNPDANKEKLIQEMFNISELKISMIDRVLDLKTANEKKLNKSTDTKLDEKLDKKTLIIKSQDSI